MIFNYDKILGQRMELFCQYAPSEKHSKLNDKSQLQVCGFKPENAPPDRPGILVLTYNDGEVILFNDRLTKRFFREPFICN